MRRLNFLLTAAFGVVLPGAFAHAQDFEYGRILVKFKAGVSMSEAASYARARGGRVTGEIDKLGIKVVSIPYVQNPRAAARAFASDRVEFAEPDYIAEACLVPNDPWYAYRQWHLRTINAPAAWDLSVGQATVTVAVLDSGVNSSHPDLEPNMVSGWNFYNGNANTSDETGHGTCVASTVAARGNNGTGVASVAWNCQIMPLRISDSNNMALHTNMAKALVYAADHGARVANLSFQLSESSTLQSGLQYFYDRGGLVVSAAGNDGVQTRLNDSPFVITVAGTDGYDQPSKYSNFGKNIDLAAPDSGYVATWTGGYSAVAGTSISAPYVSGALALLFSVNRGLKPVEAERILKATAADLGTSGWDAYYGWGRLDVGRAVAAAAGATATDVLAPSVMFETPVDAQTLSGTNELKASATDNNLVDRVSIWIDGALVSTSLAPPYSYSWNTNSVADGQHVLTAEAVDNSGNKGSTSITVFVKNQVTVEPPPADTMPPSIAIVSPSDGGAIGKKLVVKVKATDNVSVTRVETLVDGAIVATSTSAPFDTSYSPRKLSAGAHRLTSRAFDGAGNWSESSITIYK